MVLESHFWGINSALVHATSLKLSASSQVDDDSFVVVDKLYDELKHTNFPSGLYWGFFDGRAPVIRGEGEKYRETE